VECDIYHSIGFSFQFSDEMKHYFLSKIKFSLKIKIFHAHEKQIQETKFQTVFEKTYATSFEQIQSVVSFIYVINLEFLNTFIVSFFILPSNDCS
jgi:hypothetical protein